MAARTKRTEMVRRVQTASALRRVALRLRVRLWRRRIDADLADGRLHGGENHALRAAQLATEASPRNLARSLREVVDAAENPRTEMLGSTALIDRHAVLGWLGGLLGLAERLERSGPICPCGVARGVTLISDGMGPLYNPASERSLGEVIWSIADGLDSTLAPRICGDLPPARGTGSRLRRL
jgi:hypothetical protein